MLAEWFYWTLNMSIVGIITGIAVLLVRAVPCIPRRVILWLWVIPLCRFSVPFGIGSRFGLMALVGRFFAKTVTIVSGNTAYVSSTNFIQSAEEYFPITYKSFWLTTVFRTSAVVWLVGMTVMLVLLVLEYCRSARQFRDLKLVKDNIYCSSKIDSPLVYGIFRPRIIVPESDQEPDKLILLHEQMHIRRLDNMWRLIAFIVAAFHWFNPFAWLFLHLFLKDQELACDECVLASCTERERKMYAVILLDTAQARQRVASSLGGAPLRDRLPRILSFRKMTVVSIVASIMLVCTMAYLLLTNAV